jgi:hypothetical protein
LGPLTLSHMSRGLVFQVGGVSDARFFSCSGVSKGRGQKQRQLLCAGTQALCTFHTIPET